MASETAASNERNVLLLTGVGHVATRFFELMFPTLAVALARQQHVAIDEVLSWSFLGYLAFALGALPMAFAGDRVGARLPLLVSLFGLGVAAIAASEVAAPRALMICLVAIGALASVCHPLGMSLIARSRDASGRAFGAHGLVGNAAVALTPLLTAALCARFGWQDTYRLVGYAMCALAVGCAFLPVHDSPPPRPADADRSAPIAWRPLLMLLLAATLAGVSYRGSMLVQPAFFAARVSEVWFGAALSAAYLLGIAGQYLGERFGERHDPRRIYLLFHACSLPPLLLMTLLAGVPLVVVTAAFVFFSFSMQPIEQRLIARYAPPHRRAAISALRFACSFGVGSLAVLLVSWAISAGGLVSAILCLGGVVLLVIVAAVALLRMNEQPQVALRVRGVNVPAAQSAGGESPGAL